MEDRALIRDLRLECLRSIKEALRFSKAWTLRSNVLKARHGDDTPDLYIAKRDDMRLKEYMSAYIWHRDNAGFCNTAIALLMNEEISRIAGIPAQREGSHR